MNNENNENFTKTQELLSKTGVCSFVPKGNSMWPFIKNEKQSVIIKSVAYPISLYDVIMYKRKNGQEVLHRVVGFKNNDLIVTGDGILELELVKTKNVFGTMQGFYKGKKLINANDEEYLFRVKKWYGNPKKRERKIKRFNFRVKVKNKIKLTLKKFFRGKK